MDVEEPKVEFSVGPLEPWHLCRSPDGKVGTDKRDLRKHFVLLQTVVEAQGDVVPEVVVTLGS